MNVLVRYQAQLRHLAGVASETATLSDGATVNELLLGLAERRPALKPLLLDQAGNKRHSLLAFVRDRQAEPAAPLADGDEVLLMTPIAGGSA